MLLDPRRRYSVRLHEPVRFFPYGLLVGAFRGTPLPSAGEAQGKDKPGQWQYGYNEHRQGEAGVIRDETEQRSPDTAEPDGEPHRNAGREPDASGQVLLSHNDGNPESPHRGRPNQHEQPHAEEGTGECEAEDQGWQHQHRGHEYRAPTE